MKDGGLRPLFRQKFHTFQWTSIETAITGGGTPDSEFCSPDGIQGWIEFKATNINAVAIKPLQVSWLTRRCRYGGNAWVVVRQNSLTHEHKDLDELWLMFGDQAEALVRGGLKNTYSIHWSGGPGNWDYDQILNILTLKFRF